MSPGPYIGRGLVGGTAEGEAVVSLRAFTFAHGRMVARRPVYIGPDTTANLPGRRASHRYAVPN